MTNYRLQHRGADRSSQCDDAPSGRLRAWIVAPSNELGPLGRGLQRGRICAGHGRLARRSGDGRRGQPASRRVRGEDHRPDRRSRRRGDRPAQDQAGRHRALLRWPADPDRRRPGVVGRIRCDRPGTVSRCPAVADLRPQVRFTGVVQSRQPAPGGPSHLRPVSLRLCQRRQRDRGQAALRDVRSSRLGGSALPGCCARTSIPGPKPRST